MPTGSAWVCLLDMPTQRRKTVRKFEAEDAEKFEGLGASAFGTPEGGATPLATGVNRWNTMP